MSADQSLIIRTRWEAVRGSLALRLSLVHGVGSLDDVEALRKEKDLTKEERDELTAQARHLRKVGNTRGREALNKLLDEPDRAKRSGVRAAIVAAIRADRGT